MTLPDGEYAATVDRIVDGETAVLLIEDDDAVIEQVTRPVEELPADCEAGSVLEVTVADGELVEITPRPDETAGRRERIAEKLDRLSRRLDDE
ncbi:DUF3006 domain-containing protein [Halobacteriales archaeon QH_10_67_13]|nr:MAG: DUF3006 domain-containing protein [Halobacteriales archaeon QH_10_67_13]